MRPDKIFSIILATVFLTGLGLAGVTSADQVEYNSNSGFFDGEVFTIDFNNNFDTDKIDVFLDSSELDSEVDSEVDQDLEIFTNHQTNYARYSIGDSARRDIPDLELTKFTVDENPTTNYIPEISNTCYDVNQDGASEYSSISHLTLTGYKYDIHCATQKDKIGSVGNIDTPEAIFEVEWCVNSQDRQRECKTITNGDAGSGVVADLGSHAKVRFGGAFSTGNNAPIPDDSLALHSNSFPNGWLIISESNYDTWDNYVSNTLWTKYSDWASGQLAKSTLENELNSKESQAYSIYTDSEISDASVEDSSFDNGQLRLETDNLGYPQSTVYVDAGENGYIEVSKPTGVPSVISTSEDTFGELESGKVSATVENVGEGEGSFSGRITSCGDGFNFDDTQKTSTVGPGSSHTFDFRVSFSSTNFEKKEISDSCTFEVKDTGSGATDTASISVTGVQENECTPGNYVVKVENGNEVIYQCAEDGLSLKQIEQCKEGEKAVPSGESYECQETDDVPTQGECRAEILPPGMAKAIGGWDGTVLDPICLIGKQLDRLTSGVSTAFLVLDLFVAGVASLFGWFVGSQYLSRFTSMVEVTDRRSVKVGLGVITGLMFAVIAFNLFGQWWIKLLLVIAGIIIARYVYPIAKLAP